MKLIICCDGGYKKVDGWPGIATFGWLAHQDTRLVFRESGVVCWGRGGGSLVAEYGAIVAALRWVKRSGLDGRADVEIRSDCLAVIERLNGVRQVRRVRGLIMLHRAAIETVASLRRKGYRVTFQHVPRAQVAEAHTLCRRVYRQKLNGQRPRDWARIRRRLRTFLASGRQRPGSVARAFDTTGPRAAAPGLGSSYL